MSDTQTLNWPDGEIDITWTLEQHTDFEGKKLWILRIKVCNHTDKKIRGRLVENPWRAEGRQKKIYAPHDKDGNEDDSGEDRPKAIKQGKELNIPPKKCEEHAFHYREKPFEAYTDVYLYGENGKLKEKFSWGATQELTPVVISSLKPRRERTLALAVSLPFPMSLDQAAKGPIKTAITDIKVPKGFVLAHCWPGINEPMEVQHAQRGNQASVVLQQVKPIPKNSRLQLLMTQKICGPAALADWTPRQIGITLTNDVTPPKITTRKFAATKGEVEIEALLEDGCSGIASAELILKTRGSAVIIEPVSLITADKQNRLATFKFPDAFLVSGTTLTLRVLDYAGNAKELKLSIPKPRQISMKSSKKSGRKS
jgi:hypothetical protein